jgi:hypothetical protein
LYDANPFEYEDTEKADPSLSPACGRQARDDNAGEGRAKTRRYIFVLRGDSCAETGIAETGLKTRHYRVAVRVAAYFITR